MSLLVWRHRNYTTLPRNTESLATRRQIFIETNGVIMRNIIVFVVQNVCVCVLRHPLFVMKYSVVIALFFLNMLPTGNMFPSVKLM